MTRPKRPTSGSSPTGVLAPAQQHALAAQLAGLDPVALADDLQRTLTTLWALRDNPRRLLPAHSG